VRQRERDRRGVDEVAELPNASRAAIADRSSTAVTPCAPATSAASPGPHPVSAFSKSATVLRSGAWSRKALTVASW
jgi:hypothetical protein